MSVPSAFILALVLVASALLAIGGARLVLTRKDRHKGSLMLLAALVFLCNVLIWAI